MTVWIWVSRVWRNLTQRSRLDRELHDEMSASLELVVDEKIAGGMSPTAARRAATIEFGGVEQVVEHVRAVRTGALIGSLMQDLRYGCRMLARSPGFTIVAVVSLAIGIGANCAVFSLADALLLRPLSVPRPGEVLTVGSTASVGGFTGLTASYADYVDIRDRSKSFAGLVGFTAFNAAIASEPDATPKLRAGMLVSGNFFTVMGVEPLLGRAFRPEEDQVPGRDAVVILGHDSWERQFGADRSILGRTVRLNGIEFTVIGVAPPVFTGLDQFVRFEFYAPLMMWPRLLTDSNIRPLEARDFRSLSIKGRPRPGVTVSEAQSELSVIGRDLERTHPDTNRNRNLAIRTELQNRIAQDRDDATLILMLAALAAAVLFVACANVAGLLTSRAPVRAREIALRLAIGAGRIRILRQLVTESALIAVVGGVLGLGVGYAGVTMLRQFRIPTDLPIVASFELDRRALLFSLGVAIASVVLFGLAPAVHSTRADLTGAMKATGAEGLHRRWVRAWLVGGQVAVSVVLLVVAMFVYRGFHQRLGNGPGYRTDHLLMMSFNPGLVRYSESQAQQFFEQLIERARLVPGVKSAALTSSPPMMDGARPVTIVPEGFQFPVGQTSATVPGSMIDDGYFETMGLSMVKGRGFRATDSADAPMVAIVNEQLAQHYWPGQNPLGKRFRLTDGRGPWVEIVGLAKDSKYFFIMESAVDFVYLSYRQRPQQAMTLMAESLGDPSTLAAPLRDVVRSLDTGQPIFNVRTMEEFYRMRVVVALSLVSGLIGALGIMGLALAIVGLYGLVAYAASRRTKEIGIRMAIGASRSAVLRMVLRQGLVTSTTGLCVGLLLSVGAARTLPAIFPGGAGGDGRTDVFAFLLAAATVMTVTLLAAFIPARRASRVDPIQTLRYE